MASSIDLLKATISKRGGVALGNRYKVIFETAGIDPTIEASDISLLCDKIQMPGRIANTMTRKIQMKEESIAYGFSVIPLQVSFMLTNDWMPWDYLNTWHNIMINNLQGQSGKYMTVNFKSEYQKAVIIDHLDTVNNIKRSVMLQNVFPIALTAVELGNETAGSILSCSVSFNFDNWADITDYRISNNELTLPRVSFSDIIQDLKLFRNPLKSGKENIRDVFRTKTKTIRDIVSLFR